MGGLRGAATDLPLQAVARMGRQEGGNGLSQELLQCSCSPSEEAGAEVCGTDGKTYSSPCQLKTSACGMLRRQGDPLLPSSPGHRDICQVAASRALS